LITDRNTPETRAKLNPIFDQNGGIVSIEVIDGGSNYVPESSTLHVQVDYNGSVSGSGFRAGPIYTVNGVVSEIRIDSPGQSYIAAPLISLEEGGINYVEGEAVQVRVVSQVGNGVSDIRLRANGNLKQNRPIDNTTGSGFVEVVANDPYYDLFWVPDRDPTVGVGKVDGLGVWSLEVEIEDTKGNIQVSEPIELRVVNSKAPYVRIVTPEDNTEFVFDATNPITLVADANDTDGRIRQVQFFINNLTTDINGTKSFISEQEPYTLEWIPDTIGTYEIRAMAVDNGGVSVLSKSHQIKVKNPIGEKPIADFEFPVKVEDRDPFSSFYSFYYSSFSSRYMDEDVEIGSTIPLNVRAYDDDGVITSVEFFVNNESIGFVRNRYDGIYSLNWTPKTVGQAYVYAEVSDNDANKVRTEVRVFNVGTNLGKEPSVEVAYVRKSSGLKYNVRVLVHDIIEPDEFFYDVQFDPELLGDFSLNLMVNGVSVEGIGVNALPKYDGLLLPLGDPEISTTYYYDFNDFIPVDSGTLEISALLMSRQNQMNYRQAYLSNSIDLEITDQQLGNVDAPNLPPDGVLISPRVNEFASATAFLSEVLLTNDENYGKLSHIRMDNIGFGYDPKIFLK
jgi:hypothetical protein